LDFSAAASLFNAATEVGDRFWMKRGMPTPDAADATALCFSEPDGSPFPRASGFTARSNIQGWPMSEVKQVTVIIANPSPLDPNDTGRVTSRRCAVRPLSS
jgi:hypothetical protein